MQVKKFEKLNLSKFDAFKQNEMTGLCAMQIEGGYPGETGTWAIKPGQTSPSHDSDQNGGTATWASYRPNDGFK